MGNSGTIYKREDVTLPGYGQLTDSGLETVIEASVFASPWNDKGYQPYTGKRGWTDKTDPRIVGSVVEKADIIGWSTQLSRPYRQSYGKRSDWENSARHWLNQHAVLAKGQVRPSKDTFDVFQWRTWGDPFGGGYYNNNDQRVNWQKITQYIDQDVGGGDHDQVKFKSDFTYLYDWSNQQAATDPKTPPPPDIHGFGITDFLEWLTGWDYFELFLYEYTAVLVVALFSIAYTDTYFLWN